MSLGTGKGGWFQISAVKDWQIILYIAGLSMIYVIPAIYDRWKKRRSDKRKDEPKEKD